MTAPLRINLRDVLAVLFGVLMCWIIYHDFAAKRQAREFCATVSVGDPTNGILERALAAGADRRHTRWLDSPQIGRLPVTFIGLTMFERHACAITAAGGVVTERLVTRID